MAPQCYQDIAQTSFMAFRSGLISPACTIPPSLPTSSLYTPRCSHRYLSNISRSQALFLPPSHCILFPLPRILFSLPFSLFFYKFLFYLFIFGCVGSSLCGLSLVAASGGYSSLHCAGFSLRRLLLLQSTSSRRTGFSSCGTQPQ